MKTQFSLGWIPKFKNADHAFKNSNYADLFKEYIKRISYYQKVSVTKNLSKDHKSVLWLCHGGQESKNISSMQVAKNLSKLVDSGVQELTIAIGPSDGFTNEDTKSLNTNLIWSFGNATYPHELAAVIAAEQFYRAWTIIKNHPYHSGH